MKPCEFCGREIAKGRFCSAICRDAADASEFKPHESIQCNQLVNWIRLQINKPEIRGWMKKRHLHE